MSRIIGYSDNANHLLKSRSKGYSDGTNHPVKERWVGGADGANHKVWSSLSVGDTYALGGYNWTVVDINASGQAALLCQSSLGSMVWDAENDNGWINATIQIYLDSTFYNTFSAADKAKIVPVTQTNLSDWANGQRTVVCNVWLLDQMEIKGVGSVNLPERQFQWFVGKTDAQHAAIFEVQHSWLRSAADYDTLVQYIRIDGRIDPYAAYHSLNIRPAILINP